MTPKLLIFILAIIVVAGLIMWSGKADRQMGTADSSPAEEGGSMPQVHRTAGLPLPTISRARLAVQGPDGTDLGEVSLAPNDPTLLPNTSFRLKLTDFYTQWNWDKRPLNLSYDERNPAVKVEVLNGDSVLYYQWAFKAMRFFRRGGMMGGHPGTETDQLAFTLLSYENLTLPERPAVKE